MAHPATPSPSDAYPAGSGACPTCGFDATEWNAEDTANTLRLGPTLRQRWAEGATEAVATALAPLVARADGSGGRSDGPGGTTDAVHGLWHDLLAIAAHRAGSGDGVPEQRGVVDLISVSRGGVPKLAVVTADVGRRGLTGDRQRTRRHHGRPWQALCLWSGEVIDALVAEGHPLAPGAAGENLTLRGLDWSQLRAGAVLQIGSVRGQLSAPAMPCAKNNQWFSDADSRRIDHERHPGWSRWYASVLVPGPVAVGDVLTVS